MEISNQFGHVHIFPNNGFHYTGWVDIDTFIDKFLDEETINWDSTEEEFSVFMTRKDSEKVYKILIKEMKKLKHE